jgi:flagellar basal body-associated protein FliL
MHKMSEALECRICLEEGKRNDFIAPCSCNGYSKWVHPKCLNKWRSDVDRPMAFYECFECRSKYQFENYYNSRDKNCMRHSRFYALVTRDIFTVLVIFTGLSMACGYLVLLLDESINYCWDDNWNYDDCYNPIRTLCGFSSNKFYILGGAILLFALIGMVFVCMTGSGQNTRYKRPVNYFDQTKIEEEIVVDNYREIRTTRTITRTTNGGGENCCIIIDSGGGGDGCGCNSNASRKEDEGVLIIIFIIIVLIFAIIGFFVGIFWFIQFMHDICIRHYHHLILKVKSDEYNVKDLSSGLSGNSVLEIL